MATSRLGVAAPAIQVDDDVDLHQLAIEHWPLHYIVCDEAQFYSPEQCDQLAKVVDDMEIGNRLFFSQRDHTPAETAACHAGAVDPLDVQSNVHQQVQLRTADFKIIS